MLTVKQREQVACKVKLYVELANSQLNANMGLPDIKYTLTGTTAGTARGDFELNLNAKLLEDNWELYFEDTIPHEVAHLIDFNLYGIQYNHTRRGPQRISHGSTWKNIMRQLGGNPTRTHDMDVSKTAQPKRKFIYVCECCKKEITLSIIRHNKLVRNPTQYSHCRGHKLTLKQACGKVTYAEAAQMKNTKPATKATPKPATKPKATVAKKRAPAKKAPAVKVITKKLSKDNIAFNLFRKMKKDNPSVTREDMISAFIKKIPGTKGAKLTHQQASGFVWRCNRKATNVSAAK